MQQQQIQQQEKSNIRPYEKLIVATGAAINLQSDEPFTISLKTGSVNTRTEPAITNPRNSNPHIAAQQYRQHWHRALSSPWNITKQIQITDIQRIIPRSTKVTILVSWSGEQFRGPAATEINKKYHNNIHNIHITYKGYDTRTPSLM